MSAHNANDRDTHPSARSNARSAAPASARNHPERSRPVKHDRSWTILLYMAGDNGRVFDSPVGKKSLMAEMTGAGHSDIAEAQQVGTTDDVAILAQFDTLGEDDRTVRLEIGKGGTTEEHIVETISETNCGDPATLTDFIVWGMQRCPAQLIHAGDLEPRLRLEGRRYLRHGARRFPRRAARRRQPLSTGLPLHRQGRPGHRRRGPARHRGRTNLDGLPRPPRS